MKKLLVICFAALCLFPSCGIIKIGDEAFIIEEEVDKPQRISSEYIKDYSERMKILKEGFPELYQLFVNGKIKLGYIVEYTYSNGEVKYDVNYSYVEDSSSSTIGAAIILHALLR